MRIKQMHRFLKSRGWRRYLVSWWYKPLPGWRGPSFCQELFGTAAAFEMEN
jgi:hypothetical protein